MAMILCLLPALAFGQDPGADQDKVSNDQPGRPLQMPPASTEVKEAFDDFERFQRRGAWERALKALYTIPEAQTVRFVDGDHGFIVPVARKRRSVLAALPPEGQAAYRLFYDAEAKKLFEESEGPAELKTLERVYSAYFLSSVGDNAADRLGDLYFELGHFDRAADCWLAVVRERPDTDLAPGLLSLKAALALARAGRRSEFEQVRAELADRYADETVTVAGQAGRPAELLRRLLGEGRAEVEGNGSAATGGSEPAEKDEGPVLGRSVDPVWQMRFAESVEAGMTPPELTQWESNGLSAVVPAVAVDGSTLLANYLGYVFALDLKTGKLLWRSAPFHHLEIAAMQDQVRALDATRFAIVARGGYVWSLGRELKEPNYFAPFRLTCRRVEGGSVVWQSADLADYAQFDLVGPPLLAGGRLFITAKSQANPQQAQFQLQPQPQPRQGQPQLLVLAVEPHDGKVLWSTEVGVFRQGQPMYFYYGSREPSPQPQLTYRAGALYVDSHVGVLARLDADSGALDWGYGYPTDSSQGMSRIMFYPPPPQEPATASSPPLAVGEGLLVKGVQSDRIEAVEPNRMKVLWDRPIAKVSRLLGADDRVVFLGGPELSALEIATRRLLWATRVPGGSMDARLLVRPDGIWQLTSRGIFEIDPTSGEVRRIFRGNDLGTAGGDLHLTDGMLLAVSNRTISAYPRPASAAAVSAPGRPRDQKGERVE